MSDINRQLAKKIIEAARLLSDDEIISLHEPSLSQEDQAEIIRCLESGFVSSVGQHVSRFEEGLSEYTRSRYVVATSSGTAALQTALKLIGIRPNDEVLMPSLTFIGTANAASYLGGIPHFIDIDPNTLGMCPNALESWLGMMTKRIAGVLRNRKTGNPIKAILPVHTFGHSCEMLALGQIADSYNLPIVEDAAEALGSLSNGKHLGTFGQIGCISFNGNKIITTGGGGALITDDKKIAERARHITTTSKLPHQWEYFHDEIGYNFRMPNLNAALGVAQLRKLESLVASKRALFNHYKNELGADESLRVIEEPKDTRSNYWLQTIVLSPNPNIDTRVILSTINASGVNCRPCWIPLHFLPIYNNHPRGPLPVTERLSNSMINLPSSAKLAITT